MMSLRNSKNEACVAAVSKGVRSSMREWGGHKGIWGRTEVRSCRAVEEGAASASPVPPKPPLPHWVHMDPMASYCPSSSLSEGLCWPQGCSCLSCMGQARELMPLGVALNQCGLVNKYPGASPLVVNRCEACSRQPTRGPRGVVLHCPQWKLTS